MWRGMTHKRLYLWPASDCRRCSDTGTPRNVLPIFWKRSSHTPRAEQQLPAIQSHQTINDCSCSGANTLNIDLSKKYLSRGRENFALNNLPAIDHRFITDEVRSVLPRLARRGEKFDAIILDPPTFSRSPEGKMFQVQHDFESLLINALAVAERDAHVLVSTNCSALGQRALEVIARYCLKEMRRDATFYRPLPLRDFPPRSGASSVWLVLR